MTASEPDKQREPWAFGWLAMSFAGLMLTWMGWVTPLSPLAYGTVPTIARAVVVGVGFGMTLPALRKLRGLGRVFALVLFVVALGMVGTQAWLLAVRG